MKGITHTADNPKEAGKVKANDFKVATHLFNLPIEEIKAIKDTKTAINADKWWISINDVRKKDEIIADCRSNPSLKDLRK